jgi:NAD(P)-dependent dehydrogenase (short-subunit alcohol dehydrogenase family)
MKQVVITGVSTGIGHASVKVLIDRGYKVFGSVRNSEDAGRLQAEFGDLFVPLLFDVTDEPAVQAEAERVNQMLGSATLEVNLLGPFVVTKAFLPLLGTDPARKEKPGRIVNISSTSARIAGPFSGAYSASKFGLEGFSESLRRELILFGIDVIIIRPGAIVTPIWQKSDTGLTEQFGETPYREALTRFEQYAAKEGANGFPAAVIGNAVYQVLTAKNPKVSYALVPNALTNWIIPRLIPMRTLDKLVAQFMQIRRRS